MLAYWCSTVWPVVVAVARARAVSSGLVASKEVVAAYGKARVKTSGARRSGEDMKQATRTVKRRRTGEADREQANLERARTTG